MHVACAWKRVHHMRRVRGPSGISIDRMAGSCWAIATCVSRAIACNSSPQRQTPLACMHACTQMKIRASTLVGILRFVSMAGIILGNCNACREGHHLQPVSTASTFWRVSKHMYVSASLSRAFDLGTHPRAHAPGMPMLQVREISNAVSPEPFRWTAEGILALQEVSTASAHCDERL